jgi:hypothetical protein
MRSEYIGRALFALDKQVPPLPVGPRKLLGRVQQCIHTLMWVKLVHVYIYSGECLGECYVRTHGLSPLTFHGAQDARQVPTN